MNIELRPRGLDQVITYFHRTDDEQIKQLLPRTVTTLEQAIHNFHQTLLPDAASHGRTIWADGQYVGDVWCYCMEKGGSPEAMLSYCIFEKSLWSKGIATKAVALFLEEVRTRFDLHVFGAFCYAANAASIHVLERNGFRQLERFSEGGIDSLYFERNIGREVL